MRVQIVVLVRMCDVVPARSRMGLTEQRDGLRGMFLGLLGIGLHCCRGLGVETRQVVKLRSGTRRGDLANEFDFDLHGGAAHRLRLVQLPLVKQHAAEIGVGAVRFGSSSMAWR